MSTTIYGPSSSGARIVSLDVAGMHVIVDPLDADNNQAARDLAERIERYEQEVAALRNALAESREERSQLKAMLRNERSINDAALTGRRRFFGTVVMVPEDPNVGWRGPVLLLDCAKLFRGRSLQFSSVAEVHREHPELWVIGTTPVGDGIVGVVLDAWGAAMSSPTPQFTTNDRRVLEAIEFACRDYDGFAPHGSDDWVTIRRLVRAGLAAFAEIGECQFCREPHDVECYVLTAAGKRALHPGGT